MEKFSENLKALFSGFNIYSILDILLISALIFITFKFLINNNSAKLIKIFIFLLVAALIAKMAGLAISNLFFKYFLLTSYLAVIILYVSEMKRGIWAANKKHSYELNTEQSGTDEELKVSTEEIVKAVQNMAKRDIGALIVFINNQPPAGILESGVALNGMVSSQLIESIFIPKSPLHDGAVLIKGNKILAAGCFLPLSQEINLPKEFGTRHRAAIGITEIHNVTAIVVSEETGIISIANKGQLKRFIDGEMLKQSIEKVYGLSAKKDEISGAKWRKRR